MNSPQNLTSGNFLDIWKNDLPEKLIDPTYFRINPASPKFLFLLLLTVWNIFTSASPPAEITYCPRSPPWNRTNVGGFPCPSCDRNNRAPPSDKSNTHVFNALSAPAVMTAGSFWRAIRLVIPVVEFRWASNIWLNNFLLSKSQTAACPAELPVNIKAGPSVRKVIAVTAPQSWRNETMVSLNFILWR